MGALFHLGMSYSVSQKTNKQKKFDAPGQQQDDICRLEEGKGSQESISKMWTKFHRGRWKRIIEDTNLETRSLLAAKHGGETHKLGRMRAGINNELPSQPGIIM